MSPNLTESIEVLAAGVGWLALNKPAGLSVHNDPGGDALAVALKLLENDPALRKCCGASEAASPAHRLDRETSGVLLIALNKNRASQLGQTMEQRKAHKIYRAVVRGKMRESEGNWQMPLSDRAEGRKNPQGLKADQKPCETRFKKMRDNQYLTEIEIELVTGRQHQIRRHAVLARHAVVGDARYSDEKFNLRITKLYGVDRLLLHALSLELEIDGKHVFIEAPLPTDFEKVFAV